VRRHHRAKKIAAIAEAHDAWIVPHNPLSPVSTAACLWITSCIPNFAIQEYPSRTPEIDGGKELLGNNLATGLSEQIDGFIAIPQGPGIGLELVEDIERRLSEKPRPIRMRPHVDGSVVDMWRRLPCVAFIRCAGHAGGCDRRPAGACVAARKPRRLPARKSAAGSPTLW
jgi:hypothetical protein